MWPEQNTRLAWPMRAREYERSRENLRKMQLKDLVGDV
jgi:hypothetical protein